MRSSSYLEICLNHLEDNLELIRKKSGDKKILLMIKADAYGHGMLETVQKAFECGVRDFGCATLREAIYLRKSLSDLEFDIYVFSELDLYEEQRESYLFDRITPVISSLHDLTYFLEQADWKNIPLCLKFNTGMNRLGLDKQDTNQVIELLNRYKRDNIFHLMSHFANASLETKEGSFSDRQYSYFLEIKKNFLDANINILNSSIANSGAIEQGFACEQETHVRPGIIAYGATSLIPKLRDKHPWPGKLVSRLRTKVLKTFELKKGDPLGYGATVVPQDCEIIILPLGYGDGLHRNLEKCFLSLGGIKGKIFGRLNMDMLFVMVEKSDQGKLQINDEVFFWDENPASLLLLSDQLKTISYEVLCHLGPRLPRVYRE